MSDKTILILGINGSVGTYVTRALLAHGWQVRALVRDGAAAATRWKNHGAIDWIEGDAMDRDMVVKAGQRTSTILHAVSPAGYQNWSELVLPMIDNTIAAAKAAGGARIVLPGTIYNYEPAQTPVIREDTSQQPVTEKGRIRVELERRLEAVSAECPALIVRAGDFIGPDTKSSWFAQSLVRPGTPVRRMINPGKGIGHSWAYLPDLAEAFVRLLAVPDRLKPFERVQFQGIWDADGNSIPNLVRAAIDRDVPEYRFPWWLMRLLSPFGGFPKAVCDIEPYWRHAVRLDNERLIALIGEEPHTPPDRVIRDTLRGLGCLD